MKSKILILSLFLGGTILILGLIMGKTRTSGGRTVPPLENKADLAIALEPLENDQAVGTWLDGSAEDVFKELTRSDQPQSAPRWEDSDWETYCQLLAGCGQTIGDPALQAAEKLLVNLQSPPQRPAKGPLSIFQSIYYNHAAVEWITRNCLNRKQELDLLLANTTAGGQTTVSNCPNPTSSPQQAPAVPEPPKPTGPNSDPLVVVKTEWRLIQPVLESQQHLPTGTKRYIGLSVLVDSLNSVTADPIILAQVYVDFTNPTDQVCKQFPDAALKTRVYSSNCFFKRRVAAKDFARAGTLPPQVRQAIHGSSCQQGDCYLILVGVHVMSNEVPRWKWRTYWWTAAKAGLQWNNPTLTSWSFFDAAETVNSSNAIANPYLEGGTRGGMQSNCINCHQYAAYSPKINANAFIDCAGSGIQPADPQAADQYHRASLQTHFLWTLGLSPLSQVPSGPPGGVPPCRTGISPASQ